MDNIKKHVISALCFFAAAIVITIIVARFM